MVLSIASSKGGTGKTTVATNLALTLARSARVQLVDADMEEPNAHIFLKPNLTEIEEVTVPVRSPRAWHSRMKQVTAGRRL